MTLSRSVVAPAAFAGALVAVTAVAGPDNVKFPESFASGVLYATVDRADNKQHRELYTSPAAIAAAKKGEPLPSGAVITMVQYAAKLDDQKNPVKDANGRFIKDRLIGYAVMEKGTGWGAEYPPEIRNGEWEYRAFKADKTPNTAAKLENCFKCHKRLEPRLDFVFTYDRMKSAP
jgi:hypothetical protein